MLMHEKSTLRKRVYCIWKTFEDRLVALSSGSSA
jgi:hypothetical protein